MMRSKTDWGSRTLGASTRLWVSLLWLLLSGCGNDAVRSDPCTAGATRVCVCSGGASGAQSCGSDGQYGLCQCSDSDGGGGPMDATTPGDGAATDAGGGGTTDTGGGVDIPRPAVGALGAACMRNGDCNSSLCLENGRCTRSCATESDCVPGWTCGVPTGGTGRFCLCSPTQEVCDGRDNDCDGLVDNGATCAAFGVCGRTVIAALCACGNDQNCQRTTFNNSPGACQQCRGQAQNQCCPTQYMAFNTCVQTNMCSDLACARAMCGMQIAAFEMCLESTLTAEAMVGGGRCTLLQEPCLGDFATMGVAACP